MKRPCTYRVIVLGNARAPFSTESDLIWTFSQLGWGVIPLQEDTCDASECLAHDVDLFFWVHTHTWEPRGMAMIDVLDVLKQRGVPTVGYHLDKFVGLRLLDDRESRVGVHPFWKCDTVFTADGGNQEFFSSRGVNHVWLPPGICLRYCYVGQSKDEYKADVVFVGSKHYHPEWPFRQRLVEWLDEPHPWTFKRWGGDRPGAREELNDIYASCKVVVGDSCHAGSDYFWSDRVTEVQGRCGFLAHPASKGMDVTGMADYRPADLVDLNNVILYYLENENQRREMQVAGYEYTKRKHTCHNRILAILNRLGLN